MFYGKNDLVWKHKYLELFFRKQIPIWISYVYAITGLFYYNCPF